MSMGEKKRILIIDTFSERLDIITDIFSDQDAFAVDTFLFDKEVDITAHEQYHAVKYLLEKNIYDCLVCNYYTGVVGRLLYEVSGDIANILLVTCKSKQWIEKNTKKLHPQYSKLSFEDIAYIRDYYDNDAGYKLRQDIRTYIKHTF